MAIYRFRWIDPEHLQAYQINTKTAERERDMFAVFRAHKPNQWVRIYEMASLQGSGNKTWTELRHQPASAIWPVIVAIKNCP